MTMKEIRKQYRYRKVANGLYFIYKNNIHIRTAHTATEAMQCINDAIIMFDMRYL